MIARIWRSITQASKAEPYLEYLNRTIIPRYRAADGNQGVFILQEIQGELAHFLLLSFWESSDALIKFTGPDPEIAKQDPEEKGLLLAFESIVKHYKVMSRIE